MVNLPIKASAMTRPACSSCFPRGEEKFHSTLSYHYLFNGNNDSKESCTSANIKKWFSDKKLHSTERNGGNKVNLELITSSVSFCSLEEWVCLKNMRTRESRLPRGCTWRARVLSSPLAEGGTAHTARPFLILKSFVCTSFCRTYRYIFSEATFFSISKIKQ